jgi:hypothetical protein
VHGFYAARHPHPTPLALDNSEFQPLGLSEYPIFVPPGFEKLSANSPRRAVLILLTTSSSSSPVSRQFNSPIRTMKLTSLVN